MGNLGKGLEGRSFVLDWLLSDVRQKATSLSITTFASPHWSLILGKVYPDTQSQNCPHLLTARPSFSYNGWPFLWLAQRSHFSGSKVNTEGSGCHDFPLGAEWPCLVLRCRAPPPPWWVLWETDP